MDKLMQRVKLRLSKGGPAPKRGRSRLLVDSANECAAQDAKRKRSAGDALDQVRFPRNTRRHATTADEQRDTQTADQCATDHTSGANSTTGARDNCGTPAQLAPTQVPTEAASLSPLPADAESDVGSCSGGPVRGGDTAPLVCKKRTDDDVAHEDGGALPDNGQCPKGVVRPATVDNHGGHKRARWHSHVDDGGCTSAAITHPGGIADDGMTAPLVVDEDEEVGGGCTSADSDLGATGYGGAPMDTGQRQRFSSHATLPSGGQCERPAPGSPAPAHKRARNELSTTSSKGTASRFGGCENGSTIRKRPAAGFSEPGSKSLRTGNSDSPQHDGANRASSTAITPDGSA